MNFEVLKTIYDEKQARKKLFTTRHSYKKKNDVLLINSYSLDKDTHN